MTQSAVQLDIGNYVASVTNITVEYTQNRFVQLFAALIQRPQADADER